jgi:phage nucleotide-binding protein
MRVYNTGESQVKPSVVMLVYGEGGVGKTTFASTAPKPILGDCENGAKYFGLRGIKVDVAQIEKWSDMKDFLDLVRTADYQTIVLDPVGELMDKLKRYMIAMNDSKLVQKDGSPTMAGWGWLKKTLRDYIKILRDTGKNVLLIAHLDEQKDEDRIVKRPKVETKLSDELVNMVDIVAYMTVVKHEGEDRRILVVDPGSDKYTAKDRTGQLGKVIEPDFTKIMNAVQGTATYSWSKPKPEQSKEEPKPVAKAESKPEPKPEPAPEPKKLTNPTLEAARQKMAVAKAKQQ